MLLSLLEQNLASYINFSHMDAKDQRGTSKLSGPICCCGDVMSLSVLIVEMYWRFLTVERELKLFSEKYDQGEFQQSVRGQKWHLGQDEQKVPQSEKNCGHWLALRTNLSHPSSQQQFLPLSCIQVQQTESLDPINLHLVRVSSQRTAWRSSCVYFYRFNLNV